MSEMAGTSPAMTNRNKGHPPGDATDAFSKISPHHRPTRLAEVPSRFRAAPHGVPWRIVDGRHGRSLPTISLSDGAGVLAAADLPRGVRPRAGADGYAVRGADRHRLSARP